MLILLLVSVLLLSSKVEGIESPVLLYPYEYCCPPTCALADTANVTRPVKACDKDNHPLSSYHQGDLACDASHGGSAYICADQSPWAVNETTSYGFAEVAGAPCCACYHLSLVSRPGDHLTRTIVVQNIRQPALGPERNLITIFVGSHPKLVRLGGYSRFRSVIDSGDLITRYLQFPLQRRRAIPVSNSR